MKVRDGVPKQPSLYFSKIQDSRRQWCLVCSLKKSRRPLLQNQSKYHQKHPTNQSIPHVSNTKHHNIMFLILFGHPNPSRSLARVAQLSHQSVGTYWQMLNFTQAKGPWSSSRQDELLIWRRNCGVRWRWCAC